MYPVMIDGPRVWLREFDDGDLDATMAIVGDPEVTKTLSFETPTSEEQAAVLATHLDKARSKPRVEYYLAAVEQGTGELIGMVRLTLAWPRAGDLGYIVRRDRWGLGYATEIATAMLDFGYGRLRLHRVQASCEPDNPSSERVLRKLGFSFEGRLRDHTVRGGSFHDSLQYSLLAPEWRQPRPEAPPSPPDESNQATVAG
ncbi:GNAT family N-acetyltransferase [Natronosporangium hydrolyticum]|uniref:GNAT family N-acetyltransferase n=1 Tax=Natronosporangium hydrolyticum TaxID=2811111 RepID=A0A895YFW5_9ACTN|nr:GNAT family protein [Natronosporangium hydrolyticum]QSB13080.1 GNAT family N-acetyltransferase [Natronosporangium hydrolyticum]